MTRSKAPKPPDDRDALKAAIEALQKQIHKLRLEIDILNKAAEIIKKDQGIDLRNLTNKEKAGRSMP